MDGAVRRVPVEAQELDDARWAPFGWRPVDDTDPRDAGYLYEFRAGDPHVNVIAHRASEVEHAPAGLCIERLFRHEGHNQTLMALDAVALVAVAPADVAFDSLDDLRSVRAFVVRPLVPFTLHRGTWHGGPYPWGSPEVRMLNVQAKGYRGDNTDVDLASRLGVVLEVRAPSL